MEKPSPSNAQGGASPSGPPPSFLTRLVATGLFTGHAPVAPGTAGSALGLLIWCAGPLRAPAVAAAVIAAAFAAGVFTAGRMERHYGDDPSIVVVDEVVGMWISLFLIPWNLWSAIAAFFLFRLFDIVKPPPARRAEALRGGTGIMLDDVVAGVYANLLLRLLLLLFPAVLA